MVEICYWIQFIFYYFEMHMFIRLLFNVFKCIGPPTLLSYCPANSASSVDGFFCIKYNFLITVIYHSHSRSVNVVNNLLHLCEKQVFENMFSKCLQLLINCILKNKNTGSTVVQIYYWIWFKKATFASGSISVGILCLLVVSLFGYPSLE